MPIVRHRSVETMESSAWVAPGTPELDSTIRHVWRLAAWLAPWRVPPGVHRSRTQEDANARRDAWDDTCVTLRFVPERSIRRE
jgi:hypothetical protein